VPRPDGDHLPSPLPSRPGRAVGDLHGRSRLSSAIGDVLLQTLVKRRGPPRPTLASGSACDCEAMRRAKKMAAPCGTAKFREETSKKADSATRAAMLRRTK
jgi:hypothetical protein